MRNADLVKGLTQHTESQPFIEALRRLLCVKFQAMVTSSMGFAHQRTHDGHAGMLATQVPQHRHPPNQAYAAL